MNPTTTLLIVEDDERIRNYMKTILTTCDYAVLETGNARTAAIALSSITFIGSMLIANDMALITFLPLGYLVFSAVGKKRDVALVFILQNIAAHLGGSLKSV